MGFFDGFKKQSSSVSLPDATTESITATILQLIEHDQQFNSRGFLYISLTPGTQDGATTYRYQTGLVLKAMGDTFEDEYWIVAPNELKAILIDGKDEHNELKYQYYSLPESAIGHEAEYVQVIVDTLKETHPNLKANIDSSGRQLSITEY